MYRIHEGITENARTLACMSKRSNIIGQNVDRVDKPIITCLQCNKKIYKHVRIYNKLKQIMYLLTLGRV